MRAYFDSSALIKRVITEAESPALVGLVRDLRSPGVALQTSVLGAVEVSRGIRVRFELEAPATVVDSVEVALAGVEQIEISDPVITLARRLSPTSIRSLDALHLASAVLISADLIVAYDRRLLTAASELGFRTLSPGAESG